MVDVNQLSVGDSVLILIGPDAGRHGEVVRFSTVGYVVVTMGDRSFNAFYALEELRKVSK